MMAHFRWGGTFVQINRELLDGYSAASSSLEVVSFQDAALRSITVAGRDSKAGQ